MVQFTGFERDNGRIGVRNHTVVAATVVYANAVVENVADAVDDIVPIYNQYGRGLKEEDGRLHRATLAGIGRNPNVGGIVLVGWEEGQLEAIASSIAETGKPVKTVSLMSQGTVRATAEVTRAATKLRKETAGVPRVSAGLDDLVVATECGGSDTSSGLASNPATGRVVDEVIEAGGTGMFSETEEIMGGEHLLAERAASEQAAADITALVDDIEDWSRSVGYNINERNPVPDNKKGGLTTIEEKSLGAIKKGGTKPIEGVLEYGERPPASGLYFMDTPAPAQESITGLVAGGAQVVIFSTGTGNPAGNPIAPVLKVSGNERTVIEMADHIDVDISDVLAEGRSVDAAGEEILDELVQVAGGKPVSAELLGHNEFAIKRAGEWIAP
jgi:altronate dehydratase large subunit